VSAPPVACDPSRLAVLARSGDLAALDALTRCQGERLLAIGRQHCRDEEEARDAVQEALLAAVQHLDSYRGEGPLEGWVIRMVARFCGRARRGRKNDPRLHDRDVELISEALGPEEAAHLARMSGALGDALLRLNPMDRAVLLLAEADGWTGPHIASQIGATPEAVRARLTRARRRVRGALEERLGRVGGT
jgi:RNA polymerase sigma-70 factor (ECF subfamily)